MAPTMRLCIFHVDGDILMAILYKCIFVIYIVLLIQVKCNLTYYT